MKKIKILYVVTPIHLCYTEKLTEKEYKQEIRAVKKEILGGAREFAYSIRMRIGKEKIVEKINN